jgi:4-hydroxy-tetrahydrodipicolinate reductase
MAMTPESHPPLRRVVLIGVTGRMGAALLRAAPGFPQLIVTGAIASPDSLALGRDAGELAGMGRANLVVTSDLPRALAQADVVIDFSHAAAVAASLEACRAARKPLLLGTTGFEESLGGRLEAAARDIALLVAANTSLAAAVLVELVRAAAGSLPASFDIDILDLHHRMKQDAPSGTALALGAAAAEARGLALLRPGAGAAGRSGPRGEGEIGFAAVRAGDLIGEHTVLFTGLGEELSLTHRARDRAVFARGALAAALWLASQPPGRYGMRDFLGIKTGTYR